MYIQKEIRVIDIIVKQILIIFVILNMIVSNSIGQSVTSKLSLNCDDVPLESVLKLIQQQLKVEFIYDPTLVLNKKVSCNFDSVFIDDALDRLFSPFRILFKKYPDNSVVLFDQHPATLSISGFDE